MQDYAKSEKLGLNNILFFALVIFLAFLPLTSFLFFVKNDAFNGYFPPKFFMSESIHSGYLPLWNPYINYGFPQYGDMSGGYWSPITWLIAATVGYNAYSFTVELFFYILLGGIGIFKLTQFWGLHKTTCILCAITFMCCGFNVGHLQHFNWLSGTAFLPFCFWLYLKMLEKGSFKNILNACIFFYLLIASAHPGITIGCLYFFAFILLSNLFKKKLQLPLVTKVWQIGKSHLIFIVCLLILSAGLIMGYADIIPNFVRGQKVVLSDSVLNGTSIQSWYSVLMPFSTTKNDTWFATDISLRNSFFGLAFLVFFLHGCLFTKNTWQKRLLLIGFFFMLLSLGGIIKLFSYNFLPLIGYVRLDGEFRIFSLLCFILSAGIELNKFITDEKKSTKNIVLITKGLLIIITCAIVYGVTKSFILKESFIFHTNSIKNAGGVINQLKALIDSITFYDTLWIQGGIQMVILYFILHSFKNKNWTLLKKIIIADLIISTLLNVPYTGAGKASVAQLQQVLNRAPKGIIIPVLKPISEIDTLGNGEKYLLGNWSMYNKQIGTKAEAAYPIILKNTRTYFDAKQPLVDKAFLFFEDTTTSNTIKIIKFTGQEMSIETNTAFDTRLIIQQNWYPHWVYGDAEHPVLKAGINFMKIPIIKGHQKIVLQFKPRTIRVVLIFSAVIFIFFCLLSVYLYFKRSSLS